MRAPQRFRAIVIAVATSSLVVGAFLTGAAPAQAASVSGYGNGTVGVPQTVTALGICPSSTISLVATYSNGVQVTSPSVIADINGNGTIYWTPTIAGVITSATITSTCTPVVLGSATIASVSTTSAIAAPNTAQVGVSTMITVTVQSLSPSSYRPTGTVTVRDGNGATVVTMGLTPASSNGQSFAYWRWTPPTIGTFLFQATYNGDASALTSISPVDLIAATASGGTISLTAPGTMTVGVPVTLVATVVPSTVAGSAGFTFNGAPISASIPLVNGVASMVWTPTSAGRAVLGASYTTNGGLSGSTTDQVTINAGPVAKDAITLTQPGFGTWAPNGTYSLGNGSSFVFQASTLSGAAVTLTESGPCQVSGLSITIDTGSGQCNLVATSPGGSGYAGVQQGYTVSMVPGLQTVTLAAPTSGKVNAGSTLTLQKASQGETNQGQHITWTITKGKNSVCKLVFPNNGAIKLKIMKKGYCNVKAKAPGVSGQWNAFVLTRNYQGV